MIGTSFFLALSYVKLWCSSQGVPKPTRNLPQDLLEVFIEDPVFDVPIVNALGSRKLDYFEVNAIIEDANYICPNNQWQIVFLGGNNIRREEESVD